MSCSCPDYAGVCKHVAATMYGVGARLDTGPELLFTLRAVDHLELISQAVAAENLDATIGSNQDSALADSDLSALFEIDLDVSIATQDTAPATRRSKPKASPKRRGQRATRSVVATAGNNKKSARTKRLAK